MNDRQLVIWILAISAVAGGLFFWALTLPPAEPEPFFVSVDGVVYECVEEDAIICSRYD